MPGQKYGLVIPCITMDIEYIQSVWSKELTDGQPKVK